MDAQPSYVQKIDSILAIVDSYDERHQTDQKYSKDGSVETDHRVAHSEPIDNGHVGASHGEEAVAAHTAELARKIKRQVKGMQLQIESATLQIELLHGLRVSEESNHASAMKALKEKWKQDIINHKAKHDSDSDICQKSTNNQNLVKQYKALKKEEATLKRNLERIIRLGRETCKKLEEDGTVELEKAKSNWQYSEKNEFRKMEQKMIPKIKKDVAKMIELKLKKLTEKHEDEIRSLEREAAKELQSYKLELYRNSQRICKNERRNAEAEEKRLLDKLEQEWSLKIEEARSESRREMALAKTAHEDAIESLRVQHELDKKRRLEQHEIDVIEARALAEETLAQQKLKNNVELKALEDKFNEEMVIRRRAMQK